MTSGCVSHIPNALRCAQLSRNLSMHGGGSWQKPHDFWQLAFMNTFLVSHMPMVCKSEQLSANTSAHAGVHVRQVAAQFNLV